MRDFANLDLLAWSDPPLDHRYVLRREDVLVFTSDVLEEQIDVSGRASFEGVVSADCPDTDLFVSLHDVYPDGRSIVLGGDPPAMLRLAYHKGAEAEPLLPGRPVDVRIPMTWLHHSFLPGHRIRLAITSSCVPMSARNLNGGEPWPDATEPHIARVAIHRGPRHSSRLVLPVEPAVPGS
jgi:putative CocE/NonD family hydrolase